MSNILDIGRSGVLAYRTALAVTAENVANVGTEGYRRRDVSTVAIGGARATPVTAPTGGQGVGVADIRRAFDALAAERARTATADQAAAQSHLDGVRAIETLMIPGDNGIDGTLRQFFDALGALAGNPIDRVTRTQTLRMGEAVAEAVSGLAHGMGVLRSDLQAEARQITQEAGAILSELADLARQMTPRSDTNAAAAAALHPLADMRDMLLDRLATLLPVSVALEPGGRPTIRLGSEAGPLLLTGDRAATLGIAAGGAVGDPLSLTIRAEDGVLRETRLLASGALGGVSRALGALDMAMQELDSFARTLAQSLNAVHRNGVDLNGAPGQDLFAMDGWQASPAPSNTGRFQVVVTPAPVPAQVPVMTGQPRDRVDLVYDGAASLWRAFDPQGVELAAGAQTLLLPGGRVDLAGLARDGDRVTLTPVTGRAADLRWVLHDPAALAAAAAFATAAAPGNSGTASLSATMQPLPASALAVLPQRFDQPPLDLLGGAVGVIPAGSLAVELASLGRAATTVIAYPAGAERLDLAVDGVAQSFDLSGYADAAALAADLGNATLRSDTGRSLSSLGVVATVDQDGALVLTRPSIWGASIGGASIGEADPGAAVAATLIGPSGAVVGITSAAAAPGGVAQVITRNGQHVAGAPLSAAQAAALITPANGFLPGAVYDSAPLLTGASSGVGYRATGLDVLSVTSGQTATLAAAPLVMGAGLPLPTLAARQIALADSAGTDGTGTDGTGAGVTVALPSGASAFLIADRLSGALPGIGAAAVTTLELSGFEAGSVRFGLTGANGSAISVSATLAGADASPLAQAINAVTASTGIRAQLSPDGARLMLVQGEGHDITLSALETAAAPGVMVRPVSPDGQPLALPSTWAVGTALRQGGQVRLDAAQAFSLTEGPQATGSRAAQDGGITVTRAAAGAQAVIAFDDVPPLAEGGLLHRLTLAGHMVEVAHAPGATGAMIAASLAQSLRELAPDIVLTGQPLASLPVDGSALVLRLEGADYTLRMEQGQPVISGPETGRMTARFDADNRLIVTAPGASGGAGIGLTPTPGFGLNAGQGTQVVTGQPPDPALLPADVTVRIAGQDHVISMAGDGGLTAPPDFPGIASRDPANGALILTLGAPADDLRISAAPGTGMAGPGAAVRLHGGGLVLTGASGPLDLGVAVGGALGQATRLTNLPPEDLIVLMTGAGTQRLAGAFTAGAAPASPGALDVVISDAARGLVTMRDSRTGDTVASGVLDASGRAILGGVAVQLGGFAANGDRFTILPATAGTANADTALALSALRSSDPATGRIGMTDRYAALQADIGLRVSAADRTVQTTGARAEAALRAQAAIGAVDLDTQAARLLELQQAYQANAQSMTIARDLFDTILRLF